MDEPTASLPADEVARLFDAVRKMRDQGVAVIYVSHRLEEIFAIADRVVVLRDGRAGRRGRSMRRSPDDLVRLIVGCGRRRSVTRAPSSATARRVWEVERRLQSTVSGQSRSRSRPGEMLGLTGLRGAGQETIGRAMFGLEPFAPRRVLLDGKRRGATRAAESMALGLRFASGDRRGGIGRAGIFGRRKSVPQSLRRRTSRVFSPICPARNAARRRISAASFSCGPTIRRCMVENLSGGNQQKVVLGPLAEPQGQASHPRGPDGRRRCRREGRDLPAALRSAARPACRSS